MSQTSELEKFGPERGRYVCLRRLGAGAAGVVYEAYDRERGHAVALKTLHRADPEGIFRLKREFRQLAEIGHRNVARLFELSLEETSWSYTMELVDGVDFVRYCAPDAGPGNPRFDETRLRAALGELAAGLSALHVLDKVHRDLKPSNVLVTKSGRVVLLDFGLVADVGGRDATVTSEVAGTVQYMSPEQLDLGEEPQVAWDWYAVGTMLYQVLTGRLPFSGTRSEVARAKRHGASPALESRPEVPEDLRKLCEGLLSRESARRHGRNEVAAAAGAVVSPTTRARARVGATRGFVGRERELAELTRLAESASDGRAVTVLVHGESGIGKSALIEEAIRRLRAGSKAMTVLRGRCLERENIPFRAIDGLVDQLSTHWKRLSATEAAYILPREPQLLPHIFPVLARVPAIAAAPARVDHSNAQDRRLRAIGALREVLHRLAARTLTVLVIDDVQWMDADTRALLRYLMHPPDPPAVLWLLASRASSAPALSEIGLFNEAESHVHSVPLGPLLVEDAESLARVRLGEQAAVLAASVVEEAGGNPFLLDLLARRAGVLGEGTALSVESALTQDLLDLSIGERTLLEVVCLAAEPLPSRTAARAAGLEGEDAGLAVLSLLGKHLLRRVDGQDAEAIEAYHDRIREATVSNLRPTKLPHRFLALARALSDWSEAPDELLARAWFAAGSIEQAVFHACRAADQAVEELAFEHAARLYERCLEMGPADSGQQHSIRTRAAEALANAGRGAEAARHYLRAVRDARGKEAEALQFNAAAQLLACGEVDRGIETLAPLFGERGLRVPKSFGQAVREYIATSLVLALRHPRLRFTRRSSDSIPSAELRRVDLWWVAFGGMLGGSFKHAVVFHARHLSLALRAGEPARIVIALAAEAQRRACAEHDVRSPRTVLAIASRIADQERDERLSARLEAWAAACAFLAGHPTEDLDRMMAALQALNGHGLAYAIDARHLTLMLQSSLYHAGRLRELRSRIEEGLADAQQRGDLFLVSFCATGFASAFKLASDDTKAAVRFPEGPQLSGSKWDYSLHSFFQLLARVQAALYEGDGARASELVVADDGPHRSSGMNNIGIQTILFGDLAGRAVALERVRTGRPSDAVLRCFARYRREISRLRSPWAKATTSMFDAQTAILERRETAPEALSRAVEGYDAAGMRMHAAACRYARGKLVGGDEGRAEVAGALQFFREETVVAPEKFIAMLLPVTRLLE